MDLGANKTTLLNKTIHELNYVDDLLLNMKYNYSDK